MLSSLTLKALYAFDVDKRIVLIHDDGTQFFPIIIDDIFEYGDARVTVTLCKRKL